MKDLRDLKDLTMHDVHHQRVTSLQDWSKWTDSPLSDEKQRDSRRFRPHLRTPKHKNHPEMTPPSKARRELSLPRSWSRVLVLPTLDEKRPGFPGNNDV